MHSGDLKSKLFVGRISNGGALAIATVPTIQKPDHTKSGWFCPDFKWFLTKWRPFVRISNGWASGFQISFVTQPLFDHLKSKLGWISDPHCKWNAALV